MATHAINSYPKIYNIGHKYILDLLTKPVAVQEKVDGSQISFGKIDGELFIRSKGKQMVLDAPEKMFNIAVENITAIKRKLKEGYVYRGEYLRKPKHNSLCYNRVPKNNIILFDMMAGLENYVDYKTLSDEAERLGFECVPQFYYGMIENIEEFDKLLETESILGGVKVEGVAVKSRSLFCDDGKPMFGKYVSPEFKELHSREWKKANPQSSDIKHEIAMSLNPEARWEKAVQHLRDNGELTGTPKDIGALMKEVSSDTHDETEEHIKDVLFKWAWRDISRDVTRGLPEWYKRKLLEDAFDA